MKHKNIISCKAAATLMCQSFERKLTLKEQIALKAHLAVCQTCMSCFRQVKCLRRICRTYTRVAASLIPPKESCLPSQVKQNLKTVLRAQAA
jgi:predicted anti-sigma-YlaC factor YlaD